MRDEGLLESALARPLNLAAYGEPESGAGGPLRASRSPATIRSWTATSGTPTSRWRRSSRSTARLSASDATLVMTSRWQRASSLTGVHGLGMRTAVRGLKLAPPAAHPPMPDPFVLPEEPSAAAAVAAIGDELDLRRLDGPLSVHHRARPQAAAFPANGPTTRIACPAARAGSGWRRRCGTGAALARRGLGRGHRLGAGRLAAARLFGAHARPKSWRPIPFS